MAEYQTSNTEHLTSILITGGAGFIGSNFIPYFLEKYPNYRIINLDLLTYAGNLENLKEIEKIPNHSTSNTEHLTSDHGRYKFIHGDICNRELVEFIFNEYDIQGVIHFAAESHVDNSIKNPGVFIETNVNGTFTLLDVAYKHWMEKPFKYRERYLKMLNGRGKMVDGNENHRTSNIEHLTSDEIVPRFHHISTDEVYGTLNETDLFTEETPYAPNSPYSASKASSDMIVRSYKETYGLNTVITNCSNNYGPKQHDEKLIPTIIRKALAGEPIPIYGDGKNVRDWLYVLDHCKGIDLAYHTGKAGETYNIGGRNERTNLQIVDTICSILDEKVPFASRHPELDSGSTTSNTEHLTSYKSLVTFVHDRPGHDRRYAIDATKIETELGWKADENFDTGIVKTVDWYLEKYLTN
jgi:dTDP-glucose 4,6-dehydratase